MLSCSKGFSRGSSSCVAGHNKLSLHSNGGANRATININLSNMNTTTTIRGMATLKEVKNRLNSVKSIKKITGSMKLVAAAKLRVAQKTLEETKPFSGSVEEVVKNTKAFKDLPTAGKKGLIVPITSDRGLCGAVNSTIIKEVKKIIKVEGEKKPDVIIVGEKGKAGLLREAGQYVHQSFKELVKKPPVYFADVLQIGDQIAKQNFDYLSIYYNRFITVINSQLTEIRIGPKELLLSKLDLDKYDFDDLNQETLTSLYEFYIAASLYTAITEHATAEVGARMSAMDSATKNAGEMINALTLAYNRRRQAAITTELCEIIGGAESLKG